jgi:putative colanic acid biosynthesis UDP-glucose lipid carrier transferase
MMQAVFPALDGFALTLPERRAVPRDGHTAKRLLDIVVASTALVLLLPVLTLTAIAVAMDSKGPVIFAQRRTGLNGKTFAILKFRSMHVMEDGARIVQAAKGDARVTRTGRIIRKLSLDELPQLINVLAGEMSLVGPRPHAVAHDDYYGEHIANYRGRFWVKPGITGWAQVNGSRGATPTIAIMQNRINLDVWYARNRSLLLDLKILAKTPLEVLSTRNAD